jgi:hypothetical protein
MYKCELTSGFRAISKLSNSHACHTTSSRQIDKGSERSKRI